MVYLIVSQMTFVVGRLVVGRLVVVRLVVGRQRSRGNRVGYLIRPSSVLPLVSKPYLLIPRRA